MRLLVLSCFALFLLLPQPASAKSHLWKFTEVFSNADGSVQFIEMFVFDPAGTGEWFLAGQLLESNANTFVFPINLPMENTFERWILIATPAFAALPDAPSPDYVLPPQFFDPAGDELRYRTTRDILPLPPGAVPVDGIQSYLRDGTTDVNSPTNFAGDAGSIDLTRPCANALDDDGDGAMDYPNDLGCWDADWPTESPQCQDGINNDPGADSLIDFDGGQSIYGDCGGGVCPEGVSDPEGDGIANPDPECVGKPWRNKERAGGCGLGVELGFLLLALWLFGRGRREW